MNDQKIESSSSSSSTIQHSDIPSDISINKAKDILALYYKQIFYIRAIVENPSSPGAQAYIEHYRQENPKLSPTSNQIYLFYKLKFDKVISLLENYIEGYAHLPKKSKEDAAAFVEAFYPNICGALSTNISESRNISSMVHNNPRKHKY